MDNKLITVIMTVVVGVILAGSLLVPVIQDAQNAHRTTYSNLNQYSTGKIYDLSEEDYQLDIVVESAGNSITLNGDSWTLSNWQVVSVSDGFAIRAYSANMAFATPLGSWTVTKVSIHIEDGTATYQAYNGSTLTTSGTAPVKWAFILDNSGEYSARTNPDTASVFYANSIADIYFSNWISATSEFVYLEPGTDIVRSTKTDTVLRFDGEYLNNGVTKYSFSTSDDSISFVLDHDGEPYTAHPYYLVVKSTVYGIPDDDHGMNMIYGAIPIIFIVALLSMVAFGIVRRND